MKPTTARFANARILLETIAIIIVTWLLLGWLFDRAFAQADGTVQWIPYLRSELAAGFDWTHHLYRFGVVGGSSMHDSGGSLPIIQVCALLGLSATTAANVLTVFLQTCFGYFGLQLIAALVARWSPAPRALSLPERIASVWACAFAPVLGWRLAWGHENLVLGLLPLLVAVTLVLAARARRLDRVTLAFAVFAVWNGVSGLGPQTIVYGAVFGGPLLLVAIVDGTRPRWGRDEWLVVAALAAGVLLAVPRVAGMALHATSDDYGRSGASLTYSFGSMGWRDWLTSIPWTARLAEPIDLHEHNFPIGPLVALGVLAWPRGRSRRLAWALLAGAVLAIALADDVAPLSTALLRVLPMLASFRVPARAMLPILMFVPSFALAAWLSRAPTPPTRVAWIGIAAAVTAIVARGSWAFVDEPAAWLGAIALAALVRWRPTLPATRQLAAALPVVVALGVVAFDQRFPRDVTFDPIEHGPRALHDAVLAAAPALTALDRVAIVDATAPYEMSTAFAAGLPAVDGVWFPTRRFLALVGALRGRPMDPTSAVFALTHTIAFPALQQLYNVRYAITIATSALQPLPTTNGAAWFPATVAVVDDAGDVARALAGDDLRARLAATAWQLRSDGAPAPTATTCTRDRVTQVTTDDLGQTATIAVDAPAACTLVVATNYVSTLAATAGDAALAVFPIDVALTGIAVPAGTSTIVLAPRAWIPWWARLASLLGLALAAAALGLARSRTTPNTDA